jgi:cytochrome c556
MAKINLYIPEPREPYTVDNFRQINQVLETLQNQLNTSYQQDLKEEADRKVWFNMKIGCC